MARPRPLWLLCLAFAFVLLLAPAIGGERETLDGWKAQLDQVQAALRRDGLRDSDLAALRDQVEPVRLGARTLAAQLTPRLQAIQTQLGADEAKKDENDAVPAAAGTAAQTLDSLQAALRDARSVAARAEDLALQIQDRRRALLLRRLLQRSESVLSPVLWMQAVDSLPQLGQSLSFLASDWWSLLRSRGLGLAFGGIVLGLLLAAGIAAPGRRLLLRFVRRDAEAAPSLLRKATAATWIALVTAATSAFAAALIHAILTALDLLPYRLNEVLQALTIAAGVTGLVYGLGRGLLAPSRASWRLAPLKDAAAERLSWITVAVATLGAAAFVAGQLLRVLMAPISLTAVGGSVAAIAMALLTMLALKTVAGGTDRGGEAAGGLVFPWGWLIPVLWCAAILSLVGTLAGYVAFGLFLVSQIVWSCTILSLLYVLLIATDELFSASLRADARLAKTVGASMGLSAATVEQIGIVASGLFRLLLIVVGVLLVLTPWGIESGDVLGWLQAAVIGFTVGQVTISPAAILGGLALFLFGILATRAVQRWLDTRLLPRTRLDVGLRTSIRTGVGYVGVLLAAIVSISYIGLNLGNIAIVAGALSVGIGFGLQSIVNNFVSGVILLAERPIKNGDWIVVGSDQGFVKRINVRATEIETFDRASVIIPNSNLIGGVVKNWMHGDTTGRVVIPLGVAYESDPERVREILLGCADDHPSVLVYPEPRVLFKNFGESSLDFELVCFVGDVTQSPRVASDLRFAILKRLRQEGIEIPFAQRELRLRDIDRIEALFGRAPDRERLRSPVVAAE